jgi:thioredoxin-related protein
MNNINRRINLAVNIAIILVVVLIGVVFARNYLPSLRSTNKKTDYRVAAGTNVALDDIDWAKNGQTLVLVLDTKCAYCTASAAFYQELTRTAAQKRSVELVAVLPQDVRESKQYLNDLNVSIDQVKQSAFDVLRVQGTPTLILVDQNGKVQQSWAGKLPPEQETEVLNRIGR